MTIKHHLTEGLIMGYAAGTLPEAFELVAASHISMCDSCRARMEAYDTLGGALLEEEAPAEMAENSLAATLRLIDADPAGEDAAPRRRLPGDVLPVPLQSYVGGDLGAVTWRRLGGGVYDSMISVTGEATVRLLRIPGGVQVPDHGHEGMEVTLVLQGAFSDSGGRYGSGDVEVADDELSHMPVAEDGLDCICLSAMENPLKFKGLLPRIAQRVMRV